MYKYTYSLTHSHNAVLQRHLIFRIKPSIKSSTNRKVSNNARSNPQDEVAQRIGRGDVGTCKQTYRRCRRYFTRGPRRCLHLHASVSRSRHACALDNSRPEVNAAIASRAMRIAIGLSGSGTGPESMPSIISILARGRNSVDGAMRRRRWQSRRVGRFVRPFRSRADDALNIAVPQLTVVTLVGARMDHEANTML